MKNVSDLKRIFDRLPVDTGNYQLYVKLLDLDITVYRPLMEEILNGRLDIEDTRPIFSISLRGIMDDADRAADTRPRMIQTADDLRRNLVNRAFSPNEVIKEITLPNHDEKDYRMHVAEAYQARTGDWLTESQFSAIMVAVAATRRVDLMSGASKEEQIKYTNAMAVTPITER
jgi:hypothetical protein